MDAKDLKEQNVQMLRILAQCLGTTKPNILISKKELLHKIKTVHQSLEFYKDENTEHTVLKPIKVTEEEEEEKKIRCAKQKKKRKENIKTLIMQKVMYTLTST